MGSGRDTMPNPFRAAILAKMGFSNDGILVAQLPLRHLAKLRHVFPSVRDVLAVSCYAESRQVKTAIRLLSSLSWMTKPLPPWRSWSWSERTMDKKLQRDSVKCALVIMGLK